MRRAAATPFRPRAPNASASARGACDLAAPAPSVQPGARRVERPPYEQLVAEVAADGWSAVGRRYGVSDNAVRKWVRGYERERAASSAEVLEE